MLLIYTHIISPRLRYICDFIFNEQLGIEYRITNDWSSAEENDILINYTNTSLEKQLIQIIPHGLLEETGIRDYPVECFQFECRKKPGEKITAFFSNVNEFFPFDLFSASFYLLSRYEEYLPHQKDAYGRFSHEGSLAYRNQFLHLPLINSWLEEFKWTIHNFYPGIKFNDKKYSTVITYDIDLAWSHKHKGLLRNIGGWLKNPGMKRIYVLLGLKQDPFDCYEALNLLHEKRKQEVIYFFPMAETISKYDKNISPDNSALQQLISDHASSYHIGLHPSWQSNENKELLMKEKSKLEIIANRKITDSRQHYIKFNLPETYHHLMEAGIENDYSMGYGSINGFRASVASDFFWYDLQEEVTTNLRIHPYCFMDANSLFEQKQDPYTSLIELQRYQQICKEHNGTCILIFHNHIIGNDPSKKGWREMHEQFISQLL